MTIGKCYELYNCYSHVNYHVVNSMENLYGHHKWCQEQFGANGWSTDVTTSRWYYQGNRFYFLNDTDRNWFIMRWS